MHHHEPVSYTHLLARQYHVLKATNGKHALNVLEKEDIDLVVIYRGIPFAGLYVFPFGTFLQV